MTRMNIPKVSILLAFLFISTGIIAQDVISDIKTSESGISKVEVEGSFLELYLDSNSGSSVEVDGWIKGPGKYKGQIEILSERNGDVLKIWVEKSSRSWSNINGEIRVKIPANVDVDAACSSGNLFADGLAANEIKLRCSSGNLEAKSLKGKLSLRTSSGNLNAFGLEGDTYARTSSGNLVVEDSNIDLKCESSSGKIKLTNMNNSIIVAETSSGGVSLDRISGGLDVTSTSGSISGDDVKLEEDSFFQSSSGSISIELENQISSLDFDLRASSGSLRAGDRRADDRLIVNKNNIKITGRSASGSQSYTN